MKVESTIRFTPRPTAGNILLTASSTGSHTAATKNPWKPSGTPHRRPTHTWRNWQLTSGFAEMRTGWERQFRSQPNITCLKNLCKMRLIGANGFIRTLLAIYNNK